MLPNKKYTPADFIEIARRGAWLIAGPAVLGLFVALVYSSRLPNVYQAESLFQIVPQQVPTSFIPTTVTIKTEDRLEAIKQQVMSGTHLERLINELKLYEQELASRPMQDVIALMRTNHQMETVRPNRMAPVQAFYLRFKYGDPVVAAQVVDRLGKLYDAQNAQERGDLAGGTKEFLEAQLADAKRKLEDQDKKLQRFREQHAGRLPSQLESNQQAIQSLQLQRQGNVQSLAQHRDRKLMLERLLNNAITDPLPVTPATQAPGAPGATAPVTLPLRQQLDIELANLEQLKQRLTLGHPDVKASSRRVEELRKRIAAEPAEPAPAESPTGLTQDAVQRRERIAGMRAEIESLDRQIADKEAEERRVSALIAEYQTRIEAVPGVESEWLALTRDYDTMNEAFKELLKKTESARAAVTLEHEKIGEQFRMLEAPRVPLRPISPERLMISASGLGVGLVLGLALVALLEIRDGSFKTQRDIEQVLALPVIASIPNLVTKADLARFRFRRTLVAAAALCAVCVGGYTFWAMQLWKFIA